MSREAAVARVGSSVQLSQARTPRLPDIMASEIVQQMQSMALVSGEPAYSSPPNSPSEVDLARLPSPPPAGLTLAELSIDQKRAAIIHVLAGGPDNWGLWGANTVLRQTTMTLVD